MKSRAPCILLMAAAIVALPAWAQQARLGLTGSLRHPAVSSTSGLRSFQTSAVASGSRLATLSSLPGSSEAQVRIFARSLDGWHLEAQWEVPNTADGNIEIELHEDTLAVVAREVSAPVVATARIFSRTVDGWIPTYTLPVTAPVENIVGSRIRASALSNELLALAIQYQRGSNQYSEIVALVRDGAQWSLGPRAEVNDLTHTRSPSMAASGRRVAIGYPGEGNAGQPVGSTAILLLGAEWQLLSVLAPPEGSTPEGCFGCALSWDGQRIAVADPLRERVWVYRELAGDWQLPAGHTLTPPAGSGRESQFGSSVALRGETLLVAHPNRSINGTRIGGVVPFRLIDGAWEGGITWADGDDQPDAYGTTVVLGDGFGGGSDTTIAVGDVAPIDVPQFDLRTPTVQGRWLRDLALSSPDGVARDGFGGHVAADGPDRLLVSAPSAENALNLQHGRVFHYERRDGDWLQVGELPTPPEFDDSSTGDGLAFGAPLALRDNVALVAATGYDHPEFGRDVGAVFVYEFAFGQWQLRQRILAPVPQAGAQFGSAVVFDRLADDRVVIAAHLEDVPGRPLDTGRAYLYRLLDDQWQLQQRIDPPVDATAGERMGSLPASMVLIGHRLYISSWGFSSVGRTFDGIVRVYRDLDSGPTLDYDIRQAAPSDYSYFGTSIATESTNPDHAVLYVGAPQAIQGGQRTGSITRVECSRDIIGGFTCTQQPLPSPSDVRDGDWYGYFVDARFGSVIVSAALASDPVASVSQLGALYVLRTGSSAVQRLTPPPPDLPSPTRFGDHATILSGDAHTGIHQIAVAAPRYPDRVEVNGYYPQAAAPGRVWLYETADRVFKDGFE